MTTPPIGRVVQSDQLTIMLVVVHCVGEEGEGKKKKMRSRERLAVHCMAGGYFKKMCSKGTCLWGVHAYGLYGSMGGMVDGGLYVAYPGSIGRV
jgi:hypothetical protein